MRTWTIVACIAVMMLAVAGCSTTNVDPTTATDFAVNNNLSRGMGAEESLESPETDLVENDVMYGGQRSAKMSGEDATPLQSIYFDFDSSAILGEQLSVLEHNGAYLKQNTDVMIRIEGNCDTRGTNEYNMALGQRRALAAKKYLINLGISPQRMKTISFGEERAVFGENETAWRKSRRDDFVIVNK